MGQQHHAFPSPYTLAAPPSATSYIQPPLNKPFIDYMKASTSTGTVSSSPSTSKILSSSAGIVGVFESLIEPLSCKLESQQHGRINSFTPTKPSVESQQEPLHHHLESPPTVSSSKENNSYNNSEHSNIEGVNIHQALNSVIASSNPATSLSAQFMNNDFISLARKDHNEYKLSKNIKSNHNKPLNILRSEINISTSSNDTSFSNDVDNVASLKKFKSCDESIKLERDEFIEMPYSQDQYKQSHKDSLVNKKNLQILETEEMQKKENFKVCFVCNLQVDINKNNFWRDLQNDFTTTSFIKLWDLITETAASINSDTLSKKKNDIVCHECFLLFDKIDELQQLIKVS